MNIQFSNGMLKAIAKQIHDARMAGGILDVYKAAENIRLENISDNVAREDIIEKLVALAGSAFVPIEFNNRGFASEGASYHPTAYLKTDTFMDAIAESESVH